MSALWPSLLPPSGFGDDERCMASASGVEVTMLDGRRLLCGTSGLWNVNLGYGNPAVAEAIHAELLSGSYLGIFRYENTTVRRAADALVAWAGPDHWSRALFATSGGAANDLVMKLARQHHALRGNPRRLVVGLREGYHGLTFGSFALTGDELGQRSYGVDQSQVRHLPVNDVAALERLVERSRGQIAAVVVEPVLGNGAIPLDDEYVEALLALRDQDGFLLVADEVATGFGRTGEPCASNAWPQQPDVMVVSKALTNGTMAASAVLVSESVAAPYVETDSMLAHAETNAGTAVVGAAILATLAEFERLDAVASARRVSAGLDARLADFVTEYAAVTGIRGRGCFRALTLVDTDGAPPAPIEVARLVDLVRDEGALVQPGPGCLQVVPALVYTDDDLDRLMTAVAAGLKRWVSQR